MSQGKQTMGWFQLISWFFINSSKESNLVSQKMYYDDTDDTLIINENAPLLHGTSPEEPSHQLMRISVSSWT